MTARGKLLPELLPLGLGKLAMRADLSRKEPRRPSHGGRDAPLPRALDAAASRRQIAPALRWPECE